MLPHNYPTITSQYNMGILPTINDVQ